VQDQAPGGIVRFGATEITWKYRTTLAAMRVR
jgi:hypothetical protein